MMQRDENPFDEDEPSAEPSELHCRQSLARDPRFGELLGRLCAEKAALKSSPEEARRIRLLSRAGISPLRRLVEAATECDVEEAQAAFALCSERQEHGLCHSEADHEQEHLPSAQTIFGHWRLAARGAQPDRAAAFLLWMDQAGLALRAAGYREVGADDVERMAEWGRGGREGADLARHRREQIVSIVSDEDIRHVLSLSVGTALRQLALSWSDGSQGAALVDASEWIDASVRACDATSLPCLGAAASMTLAGAPGPDARQWESIASRLSFKIGYGHSSRRHSISGEVVAALVEATTAPLSRKAWEAVAALALRKDSPRLLGLVASRGGLGSADCAVQRLEVFGNAEGRAVSKAKADSLNSIRARIWARSTRVSLAHAALVEREDFHGPWEPPYCFAALAAMPAAISLARSMPCPEALLAIPGSELARFHEKYPEFFIPDDNGENFAHATAAVEPEKIASLLGDLDGTALSAAFAERDSQGRTPLDGVRERLPSDGQRQRFDEVVAKWEAGQLRSESPGATSLPKRRL